MRKNNNPATDIQQDQGLKSVLDFNKSRTDHLAVRFTDALGSISFLMGYILVFSTWICWNVRLIPGLKPFDPFPFPVLEMVVSLFAIILSVSVLIKQNRQGRIEQIRQQVDFEVNVRAENEITKVLTMLHEIQQKMGLGNTNDQELEDMKARTDIHQLHQVIDESEGSGSVTKEKGEK